MSTSLLLLALSCTAVSQVETSGTPTTELYVRTVPSGATVFVDDRSVGTSNDLFPVKPGARRIRV